VKKGLIAVALVLLVSCAGNTGIVKISDDTYMIGRQSATSHSGSVVKAALYKEVNEFCSSMGKTLVVVQDSHIDYHHPSAFAGAEIKFKCE